MGKAIVNLPRVYECDTGTCSVYTVLRGNLETKK